MAFEIEFMPDAWEHLQDFSARDRATLLTEIVFIIAIGVKEGNRLLIGGKRFEA